MDIFRLLSRSTSLKKPLASANPTQDATFPSAGAEPQPKDLGESHDMRDSEQRVVKRKRRPERTHRDAEEPAPDFFTQANVAKAAQADVQPDLGEPAPPKIHTGEEILEPKTKLPEVECKRILKLHKLKVTLIRPAENKTTKKRRSEATSRSKTVADQSNFSFTPIVSQPMEDFKDLRSHYRTSRRLMENLNSQGYKTPTEVQLGSLPILLGTDEDRGLKDLSQPHERSSIDLLSVAPTGSGKTLAFLIPVIHGLLQQGRADADVVNNGEVESAVRAIILAPTHELVDQLVNEAKKLTVGTGIKAMGMRKGMDLFKSESPQSNLIKADIVIATPLVLLHAISLDSGKEANALVSIRYLVLDEADVLLDPLFQDQTLAIWNACTNGQLQVSFWSATMGSSIEFLVASVIAKRRERLGLSDRKHFLIRMIVGLKESALPTVSHRIIYTASEQGKLLGLRQILHPTSADVVEGSVTIRPPFLVFTQTISRAIALHSELSYDIPPEAGGSSRIAVLHSDLSDTARSNTMAGFRKGEIWVLITTDLLSRGMDFRGVNGVVSYDIPNTSAAYVHRAGRTGRAGRKGGVSVTFYTKEDIPYVKNIANVIAASEKAHGKIGKEGGSGVHKWLLDALPTVSKKTRQELKKKGVECRRPAKVQGKDEKQAHRTRISTKSGFDRRVENRKKGAIKGQRQQLNEDSDEMDHDGGEEEWEGLTD